MTGTIQEKGILIEATVHMWSGRVKVREVGEAAENALNMVEGRADPMIWLVEPAWFKRASKSANLLRACLRHYCLRFGKGWLLPTALHQKFHNEWRLVLSNHRAEVKRFIKEYPRLVQEGKKALGNVQNPDSFYPTEEKLKEMFRVDLAEGPIGDPKTWQPHLDEVTVERLRMDFDALLGRQVKDAVTGAMHRMSSYIAHMAETLQDPDKNKFHKTLLGNIRELAEILPAFNLMDDPQIEEIVKDIQQNLFDGSTKNLKEDYNVRDKAAKEARRIADKMEGLFGKPDEPAETETAL